ncbi:similar to Saccharomyces cerevisiae YJL161W FMP33 Putative protein of unknown function [Maudiozyma saulgeensis]|uniref:Uncharacterized protein n=1 Tax=Maudiozyma saulgeensis TaxID=1789683 RepID=A0A1X7RA23_9SACH|nr:similar to Saccharomyces cerevisiae YJL161W FMP33 Putative protein of unknown function [Kazachstania saulgeensis]
MFSTRLLFQAATKNSLGNATKSTFKGSKSNLASNIFITSLYSLGAWSIYKEVTTVRDFEDTAPLTPQKGESISELIRTAPNRIFKSVSKDGKKESEPMTVLRTLTYGDLSQVAIGSGFLFQLSNIMHSEFGKTSFMYRASLGTSVMFPIILYFAFRLRLKELKKDNIKIE